MAAVAILLLGSVVGAVAVLVLVDEPGDRTAALCEVLSGPPSATVGYIVFLDPDASVEEIDAVGDHLASLDAVRDLTFMDQEEAYQEALELFEEQPSVQARLEPSDMPPSWRFRFDGLESSAGLAAFDTVRSVETSEGVRLVDALGGVGDGYPLASLISVDDTPLATLRESVPDDVDEEDADRVAAWLLDTPRAELLEREPPSEVRRAAVRLLGIAWDRCRLRPNDEW